MLITHLVLEPTPGLRSAAVTTTLGHRGLQGSLVAGFGGYSRRGGVCADTDMEPQPAGGQEQHLADKSMKGKGHREGKRRAQIKAPMVGEGMGKGQGLG